MSNVALSGNASGTGTFTIASPNSNTDRTLNLPDNSGTVVSTGSTAAVTQAMLETLVVPLGVGQTWQSVTRASGVTYTNTTGRPILVSFYTGTATPGNAFVNGVGITTSASASNFTFVVPAGATYSCFSISAASELR
jgi:hypothetical protein